MEVYYITELSNDTVRTINDFAGTRIPLNEKGSVVNMCKAWRDQFDSITRNLIKCQKGI